MPQVFLVDTTVSSFTDPDRTYRVTISRSGMPYCTCPAWQFHTQQNRQGHRLCKHVKAVITRAFEQTAARKKGKRGISTVSLENIL